MIHGSIPSSDFSFCQKTFILATIQQVSGAPPPIKLPGHGGDHYLDLVPQSVTSGAIVLFHRHGFMACTATSLPWYRKKVCCL